MNLTKAEIHVALTRGKDYAYNRALRALGLGAEDPKPAFLAEADKTGWAINAEHLVSREGGRSEMRTFIGNAICEALRRRTYAEGIAFLQRYPSDLWEHDLKRLSRLCIGMQSGHTEFIVTRVYRDGTHVIEDTTGENMRETYECFAGDSSCFNGRDTAYFLMGASRYHDLGRQRESYFAYDVTSFCRYEMYKLSHMAPRMITEMLQRVVMLKETRQALEVK